MYSTLTPKQHGNVHKQLGGSYERALGHTEVRVPSIAVTGLHNLQVVNYSSSTGKEHYVPVTT